MGGDGHAPPGLGVTAVRSFFWAALSFGGNRLIVFVSTVILARLLAPDAFGLLSAGLTLVLYFELVLDLGVGSAVIYEQERGITPRVQTAFTVNIIVSAVLTVVGMLAAPAVAAFFQVPQEDALFRTLFCYLLIRAAGQVNDAMLKRDLLFNRRIAVDLVRGLVRAVLSVVLALLDYGAWALVWGLLAGELAGTIVSYRLVRFRPTFRLERSAWATLLRFGMAVVGLRLLDGLASNADYLVIGNRLGPTELGFYTIGYRLPTLVIGNVLWIFSDVAFALYSTARTQGMDSFRRSMLRALRLTTLFGFPVGVGLALVARDAVPILFSARWEPAVGTMVLVSLAMGIGAVGYASGDIFPALGRPGTLLALNAPLTVLAVAGFWFAASYGITAVAAIQLAVDVCYAPVRIVVANRLVGSTIAQSLEAIRPGFVLSAGMALAGVPVLAVTQAGELMSLLAVIGAGAFGAVLALLLGARSALGDLRRLGALLRGRDLPHDA